MKAKAAYQNCNFYKKMAEGLGKELKETLPTMERRSMSVRKGSRLVGAKEKKIKNRHMLTKTESKFQVTAPLRANRGPEVSGDPCVFRITRRQESCYAC